MYNKKITFALTTVSALFVLAFGCTKNKTAKDVTQDKQTQSSNSPSESLVSQSNPKSETAEPEVSSTENTPVSSAETKAAVYVKLTNATDSKAKGGIDFKQLADGSVQINGAIEGLSPGKHGMHMHDVGDCSDANNGFKKANNHMDLGHNHHGSATDGHTGDLGNIYANDKGVSLFTMKTKKFSLEAGAKNSIRGKAIIIHSGADDEFTDPAGNSGARILCGVIQG